MIEAKIIIKMDSKNQAEIISLSISPEVKKKYQIPK